MTFGRGVTLAVTLLIALVGLSFVFGTWYTVNQGERGVIVRNGAVVGTAEPGLGFKIPWIDNVVDVNVQTNVREYDKMSVYSRDQQPAIIRVSINYRIPADRAAEVYGEYGGQEGIVTRLLDRQAFEKIKNVFGRYNAINAIQERTRLNADITEIVRSGIGDAPIVIETVQLENIDFSDAYESAIEARMTAEVGVEKEKQGLAREKVSAEIAVTQAQAQADSKLAVARSNAEATRLQGLAEADAIKARGDALRENPGIPALIQAEKWNGQLPQTMVPGSAVPFISVK